MPGNSTTATRYSQLEAQYLQPRTSYRAEDAAPASTGWPWWCAAVRSQPGVTLLSIARQVLPAPAAHSADLCQAMGVN